MTPRVPVPLCAATVPNPYLPVREPERCNAPAVHRGDQGEPRCGLHVDVCGACHGATRLTVAQQVDTGRALVIRMRREICERCDGSGVVDPATAEQVVTP